MKIGIITLSRIHMQQGAFYNLQDVGLAKAFAKAGHEVLLYRFTQDSDDSMEMDSVKLLFKKAAGFGKQTVTDFAWIDSHLDRLICFSDNQISFPGLYRWCQEKGILLQPYIGVLKSNSPNAIVANITNLLVKRNLSIYRKMKVYGKTPAILEQMKQQGITSCELVPVCLDETLLQKENNKDVLERVRCQYGFSREHKILLFVGRMEVEKEPLEMLEIFRIVLQQHSDYRLVMIGKGVLQEAVKEKIKEDHLEEMVRYMESVPNQEMWKMYGISDCMVNLNRNEIYGMSILEALYYRCPVIAMHAPGPDYMIKNDRIGYLCKDRNEVIDSIVQAIECENNLSDTRHFIEENFFWNQKIEKFL